MDDVNVDEAVNNFHQKTLSNFIPVIVIIAFACVLGIVGNAFTIYFYGFVARKTPTVYLITALACMDLVVCVLMIPNMAEMGVNVKYTNATACKIMHFLGHWAILMSGLILWVISIDRYRHVCCHFKKQLSFVSARRVVIIIIVYSFLLSLRDFANFDIIEFPIPNRGENESVVLGHYCTTTDDPRYKVSVTLFHSIDALMFVIVLASLCFTYGKIIWTMKNSGLMVVTTDNKEAYQETSISNDTEAQTVKSESEKDTNGTVEIKLHDNDAHSVKSNEPKEVKQTTLKKKMKSKKMKKSERSITLMMLFVSFIFCVCFLPYFTIKIGIRSYKSASKLELGVAIQLALRLSYVNSFANAYIFCLFNPQFRRFVKRTIQRGKPSETSFATTDMTELPSQQSG